jgi:transposase
MAPYPPELRVRVVAAVEEGGLSIPEAARSFQLGLTFIKKLLKLHRAGEALAPRPGGGPVPLLQEQQTTLLPQGIKARPAATLEE